MELLCVVVTYQLALHGSVITSLPPPVPASKTLVRPWTLLLLRTGTSHGYDIRQAIIATGYPDPGSGTIYRLLRDLENAGLVLSHWEQPAKGPERHVYRLTDEGRRQLDADAAGVKGIARAARSFAREYRALGDETDDG